MEDQLGDNKLLLALEVLAFAILCRVAFIPALCRVLLGK